MIHLGQLCYKIKKCKIVKLSLPKGKQQQIPGFGAPYFSGVKWSNKVTT